MDRATASDWAAAVTVKGSSLRAGDVVLLDPSFKKRLVRVDKARAQGYYVLTYESGETGSAHASSTYRVLR